MVDWDLFELWVPISEAPGYEISDYGRVRNSRGLVLKLHTLNSGYLKVDLSVSGNPISRTVHRLVAKAFIANPENKPEVNHIDNDKFNNATSNLEWCTRVENLDHARDFGDWDAATWCTSTTKIRGVNPHVDDGFTARITVNKERKYLGYFQTLDAAEQAVKVARNG